jgi:hypothetical protein
MNNQEYQYYFYKHTILFKDVLKDIKEFDISTLYYIRNYDYDSDIDEEYYVNGDYTKGYNKNYNQDSPRAGVDYYDRYGSEDNDEFDDENDKLYHFTDDWETYWDSIYN